MHEQEINSGVVECLVTVTVSESVGMLIIFSTVSMYENDIVVVEHNS